VFLTDARWLSRGCSRCASCRETSRFWDLARREARHCDAGLPVSVHLAVVEANSRIVTDPIHKPTLLDPRAEQKARLRGSCGTTAKLSLWQKANRDECLVTQSIRIALTRCN
jgi:hypothetical protein